MACRMSRANRSIRLQKRLVLERFRNRLAKFIDVNLPSAIKPDNEFHQRPREFVGHRPFERRQAEPVKDIHCDG